MKLKKLAKKLGEIKNILEGQYKATVFYVSIEMFFDGSGEVIADNLATTCDCGRGCHHVKFEVLEFSSVDELEEKINRWITSNTQKEQP